MGAYRGSLTAMTEPSTGLTAPAIPTWTGVISPDCTCTWDQLDDDQGHQMAGADPTCPLHGRGQPFDAWRPSVIWGQPVPVTLGVGGPSVGSAEVHPDGTVSGTFTGEVPEAVRAGLLGRHSGDWAPRHRVYRPSWQSSSVPVPLCQVNPEIFGRQVGQPAGLAAMREALQTGQVHIPVGDQLSRELAAWQPAAQELITRGEAWVVVRDEMPGALGARMRWFPPRWFPPGDARIGRVWATADEVARSLAQQLDIAPELWQRLPAGVTVSLASFTMPDALKPVTGRRADRYWHCPLQHQSRQHATHLVKTRAPARRWRWCVCAHHAQWLLDALDQRGVQARAYRYRATPPRQLGKDAGDPT